MIKSLVGRHDVEDLRRTGDETEATFAFVYGELIRSKAGLTFPAVGAPICNPFGASDSAPLVATRVRTPLVERR